MEINIQIKNICSRENLLILEVEPLQYDCNPLRKSKDRVHGYGLGLSLLGDLGISSFLDKKLGDMVKDKPWTKTSTDSPSTYLGDVEVKITNKRDIRWCRTNRHGLPKLSSAFEIGQGKKTLVEII